MSEVVGMDDNLLIRVIFTSASTLTNSEKYILMILASKIQKSDIDFDGFGQEMISELSTRFGMSAKLISEVIESIKFKQILYNNNDKNISNIDWFLNKQVLELTKKDIKIKQMRTKNKSESEKICKKACGQLGDNLCIQCELCVNNRNAKKINSASLFEQIHDGNTPRMTTKQDFFLQNFLKNAKLLGKKFPDEHNMIAGACAPACTCARAEIYNIYERYNCISRRQQYKNEVNVLKNNYCYCKTKEERPGLKKWYVKKDNTRKKKSKKHFDICSEILTRGICVERREERPSSLHGLLKLKDSAEFRRQADGSVIIANKRFRDSSDFGIFWKTYPSAYRRSKITTLRVYTTLTKKTSPRSILEALRAQKKQKEIEISFGLKSAPLPSPLTWLRSRMWLAPVKTAEELNLMRKKEERLRKRNLSEEQKAALIFKWMNEFIAKAGNVLSEAKKYRD